MPPGAFPNASGCMFQMPMGALKNAFKCNQWHFKNALNMHLGAFSHASRCVKLPLGAF